MSAPSPDGSRLDDALRGLDGLDDLPVDRHPAVFDAVHHAMREVLSGTGPDADARA